MTTQKPTLVNAIAWMTLASGVVNLFWGFVASSTALATILCFICIPITLLPAILGVFELIYAAKLFSNPPQVTKPSTNIAVFEIATILLGNVFSMVVGILALVFYNDLDVKDYFARLSGYWTPEPAPAQGQLPAPAPASSPESEPAPVPEEPIQPVDESPEAQPEETPEKPKKAPRKVAKK
jgi:hypothetical protein